MKQRKISSATPQLHNKVTVKSNDLSEQAIKIIKKSFYQEKCQTPNQNQYFPPALLPVFPLVENLRPSCTVDPLRGFTHEIFHCAVFFGMQSSTLIAQP